MRQTIFGLAAAIAVLTTSAAPAMACGGVYGCCGPAYVGPCGVGYACYGGCGWAFERLADPGTQYYFVNQGPTYTGPGAFAPYPTYEGAVIHYGTNRPIYRPWGWDDDYRYRHTARHHNGQPVLRRYY